MAAPALGTGRAGAGSVGAFHDALAWQAAVALGVLVVVAALWRRWAGPGTSTAEGMGGRRPSGPEPPARRLVRNCFGLLWMADALLGLRPGAALDAATKAIRPAAATSPEWVRDVAGVAAGIWSAHPATMAAAAFWVQLSLGAWVLAAARGALSRWAGAAGAAVGLAVWALAEGFGQVFAPGLSWLTGAPGAGLLYAGAGALLAAPDRAWSSRAAVRAGTRAGGALLVAMAVLQAWPGRGFWQGQARPGDVAGTLAGAVRQAAQAPQPGFLGRAVGRFADFDAAHGWAVNLFVVVVLAGLGAAFLTGRPAVGRWAAVVGAVVALADWVLVQDLGFVGGPGVGLGSMLPMAALLAAAGLALSRSAHPAPAPALGAADGRAAPPPPAPGVRWRPAAAAGAMAVAVASLVPMTATAAATLPAPAVVVSPGRGPAPGFDLVDQYGHRVTAASLRGKAVALAFLGPVCTVDCPVIAQEMRAADGALGALSHRVDLVAVNTDPQYTGRAYLLTFDRREGMAAVPNWLYLTASVPQLEHLWAAFGAQAEYGTGGASAAESDVAYVIGPDGDLRYALGQGQAEGPGSGSFASGLAAALRHALGSSAN